MMEAIAIKEQVLADTVKEVEQVLDEAMEAIAEYKKSSNYTDFELFEKRQISRS